MKWSVSKRAVIVAAVALGLTIVGGARATRGSPNDSETILENEKAWAKAAVDGDADRMARYMADEYLELAWEPAAPAHWSKTGKTEWVESVRSHKQVYTSVDLHDLTVHLQGNLAVVTGQYSQTGVSNGRDISAAGIYANTWAKRDGQWVVVHSIFP
jgi:ketosteroid isomerase-like protein